MKLHKLSSGIGLLYQLKLAGSTNLGKKLLLKRCMSLLGQGSSDQIWRVGLNFNWKGNYSVSPLEIKGNINNCLLIDKYKLTKPFHQKQCKKKILVFHPLLWKHTCMWWRGLSQLNPCNSLSRLTLNTPFKLNHNTKISLLMARFEKVKGVCN